MHFCFNFCKIKQSAQVFFFLFFFCFVYEVTPKISRHVVGIALRKHCNFLLNILNLILCIFKVNHFDRHWRPTSLVNCLVYRSKRAFADTLLKSVNLLGIGVNRISRGLLFCNFFPFFFFFFFVFFFLFTKKKLQMNQESILAWLCCRTSSSEQPKTTLKDNHRKKNALEAFRVHQLRATHPSKRVRQSSNRRTSVPTSKHKKTNKEKKKKKFEITSFQLRLDRGRDRPL
jgi:hypothetical protein